MQLTQPRTRIANWPGLDTEFQERVSAAATNPSGVRFVQELTADLEAARGRECRMGPPLMIRRRYGSQLRRFASAYHRMIRTIIRAYGSDHEIRSLLAIPDELLSGRDVGDAADDETIHLCRVDLLLDPSGGFKVLETNANCPGALLSMGAACRQWREYLAPFFLDLPDPMEYEWHNWMANWFIQTAIVETGDEPCITPLLREEGGNRLELPGLARQLQAEKIYAFEIDPRQAHYRAGRMSLNNRHIHHAYLKLGIPEFREYSEELGPLIDVMLSRRLFVPNGVLGRFVGDNKLCLAVLSDPNFRYLFDPTDREIVLPHIPWSRPMHLCDTATIRDIRRNKNDFVLKRPLDTKGRGVVIGAEVESPEHWLRAVSTAVREKWLVQAFCPTTQIESDFTGATIDRHDLSLGVTNGELSGVIVRSSSELRLNTARSGRLHPVFVEGSPGTEE